MSTQGSVGRDEWLNHRLDILRSFAGIRMKVTYVQGLGPGHN